MALKSTIHKAELQVSDMDRHYYATHALTLARHPSETDARMMVRLLAFALFAHERLVFGKGLSSEDEPDLWRHELDGEIALWIDLGQPDESRIRRACGRAREVVVITYAPRQAGPWWDKHGAALSKLRNLTVIDLEETSVEALAALSERGMRVQCLIQDGLVQWMDERGSTIEITPDLRLGKRLQEA